MLQRFVVVTLTLDTRWLIVDGLKFSFLPESSGKSNLKCLVADLRGEEARSLTVRNVYFGKVY